MEPPPICHEHKVALQLIRVDISQDKFVIDVYGCPYPGCKTEHNREQGHRAVESGK